MDREQDLLPVDLLAGANITAELVQRPPRAPHTQEENEAFHHLAAALAADPDQFLCELVEVALKLCHAGTVGISVEDTDAHGVPVFRWVAIAGQLKSLQGGTAPRDMSPCAICVDSGQPVLMSRPDRAFPALWNGNPPVIEALLIPWGAPKGPTGTLWLVAHSEDRKFDLQDVRIVSSLAGFACGAVYLRTKMQESERVGAALRMSTSMAHHINNPLQGALFALFRLRQEGGLNPVAQKMLNLLEAEIHRITTLSSELLRDHHLSTESENRPRTA